MACVYDNVHGYEIEAKCAGDGGMLNDFVMMMLDAQYVNKHLAKRKSWTI